MAEEFLNKYVVILRNVKDEEIIANACKSIRICLRDDNNLDYVVKYKKDFGNILLETLKEHDYSEAI